LGWSGSTRTGETSGGLQLLNPGADGRIDYSVVHFVELLVSVPARGLAYLGNAHDHGTAVAGIAAANGADFIGMAPEATIYHYKILASNRFLNAENFGGALAIQQALEDGADIVNCCWGAGRAGEGKSREARAVDTGWDLDLTVIKAPATMGLAIAR
jgi:subtilisin family serine protease